ncbi:helix-turn-helix transcriptional regulator [Planomonospora venezuelensis]|uniref:Putative DNA-binding transcriptional regulator YafY n=1 Tax=Planomonospora venezuelensis TaxID=1999 RepID=A0A841DBV5_PLAVE|nr:YafY family protein [Planomonospora venezuelensis]MBB5966969.1 putative DNA-binding transcriptional regulator YafY [Planomonospora venezuelensis]GIN01562.1 transcriptional regulator [Planomonospora venezuelensis]
MTVTRVLALLELLQASPGLTGPELAARLEVDERTVRRYAGKLAELGVPVEAERGRYGGYRLLPGYRLPPLMLTDDEATAVVLGLLAGRRTGLAVGETATGSALAKIQRVLPQALRERVEAVSQTLEHTRAAPAAVSAPRAGALLALADAVRRGCTVRLAYRSWKGEPSERDLDPYGIVFHSGRWYVAGFDHRSGEVRTFRMDRVAGAVRTERAFTVPEDFDAAGHVAAGLSAVPYRYEVRVLLETTLEEARRRIPAEAAALAGTPGGVLLTARAERLDGMAQMLAGLGWPFTVLEPDGLRAEVGALAARLAEYADPGGD